jgi:hypothetical protein
MNKMNKNTMLIVAVLLIIVALGSGFFAGMQYQKSQNPFANAGGGQYANRNFGAGAAGGQGFAGRGTGAGGGQRFTPVRGQILSLGSNTLTVKQQDGTTKIVVIGTSTTFVNTQKAAISDLKTGDTVMVVGGANSDGSITASDIQINPVQLRPSGVPPQGQGN